ncbi:MAG: hypothetical protein PW734_03385 [Verrucomicrobium sp.]|nr:hypothetical protein [Verrucomicrobium sp.]
MSTTAPVQEPTPTHFQQYAPYYHALLKAVPVVGTVTALAQSVHAHIESSRLRAQGKTEEADAKKLEGQVRLNQTMATVTGLGLVWAGVTMKAHNTREFVAMGVSLGLGALLDAVGVAREMDTRIAATRRANEAGDIVLRRAYDAGTLQLSPRSERGRER